MNHRITTALLLLAGSTLLSYAQAPADSPVQDTAVSADNQSVAPLTHDDKLRTGKLENGLSYMIRPTAEPAGRASIRLFVETGSLDESEETSGVAHFLEHLVFNGSRHYKRGELIPKMQKLGLGFGGDANAYTSLLHTVYKLDLPNLDEETVDFALTIMRDFADGATLEDEAIDKERGIVISELKSRDSEKYRAMIGTLRHLTEGSRVADFMPIGLEKVIRNISHQQVRDYYKEHYVPERMTLIITGDVKPETAEEWVRQYFGSMEKREPLSRPAIGMLTDTPTREVLITNNEQADTSIVMCIPNAWEDKPDTLEQRIKNVPLELACAMYDRRIERIVRRADSPFQGAGIDKGSLFRAAEPFTLNTTAQPEQWEAALTTAVCELRKAIQYGFTPAEMREATQTMLGMKKHKAKTWGSVASHTMADALIDCLDEHRILTTPEEDIRVLILAFQQIAQDPDICRRVLEKEFRASEAKLMMSGTIPTGVTEAKLREVFNKAMALPIEKPTEKEASTFAYDKIGEAGSITNREDIPDIGVTKLVLSNGVKVNLKPTDFLKGSIHVAAAVDGGFLQMPNLKAGIHTFVDTVVSQGGLQAHSADELESLMAGKQIGDNFSTSQDRFTYSGTTNAQDFETQCKLLVANILHPGFRPDGETLLRRRLDSFYTRLETTPDGAYNMQMPRELFGEDVRFVLPKREELESVSTADVKASVENALQTGAIEVTIVGDFKVDDIIPVITRTFGAMPQRKSEFAKIDDALRTVTFRPWGQRKFFTYDTQLDKTLVTQIRPAGDGMDYRRNRRLLVLTSIVREKLFDGLRATLGESYSPSVRLILNPDFKNAAYISTTSAGVKGNREKVSAAMETICNGIGQGHITDEDVERALRPIITSSEKNLRTAAYWLSNLSKLQSDPKQLQMIRDLKEDLQSITAEEIRELAKEVYGKNNANFFYTVPQESQPKQDSPIQMKGEEYTVILTQATAALPEWKKVADTLVAKYPGAKLRVIPEFTLEHCEKALQETQARYAAYVARPEETGRIATNVFHRAARRVDADPWGDCMWGVVTGNSAIDAQRIADARQPLIIKRMLGTTNVHYAPFEHSFCITDWTGSPILEQSGYQEPQSRLIDPESTEGKAGMQSVFGKEMSTQKPQLLITASHATQFNLEMPFGKGLIFPSDNRFYLLPEAQLPYFKTVLESALQGNTQALATLAKEEALTGIEPDGITRVWIAAGNCLFGDTHGSKDSMAITALSGYTCNQVVGYTVPTWFGEGGWGTLSLFLGNTTGTSLAEAWFLNNQFILLKTMEIDKKLLEAEFNDERVSYQLQISINHSGAALRPDNVRQAVGLVHDRDTVAFYGDPAWSASIDTSHAPAPYTITWNDTNSLTIKANADTKGRCAVWFPNADVAKGCKECNIEGAILTDDFLLIPHLEMKEGEQRTVIFK